MFLLASPLVEAVLVPAAPVEFALAAVVVDKAVFCTDEEVVPVNIVSLADVSVKMVSPEEVAAAAVALESPPAAPAVVLESPPAAVALESPPAADVVLPAVLGIEKVWHKCVNPFFFFASRTTYNIHAHHEMAVGRVHCNLNDSVGAVHNGRNVGNCGIEGEISLHQAKVFTTIEKGDSKLAGGRIAVRDHDGEVCGGRGVSQAAIDREQAVDGRDARSCAERQAAARRHQLGAVTRAAARGGACDEKVGRRQGA
ncbi:hypothetical protein HDU82_004482 [Entophlyctis luteolus]|nr:hypothetical protein HDU82_004482 [Entophlyctis luteolus]